MELSLDQLRALPDSHALVAGCQAQNQHHTPRPHYFARAPSPDDLPTIALACKKFLALARIPYTQIPHAIAEYDGYGMLLDGTLPAPERLHDDTKASRDRLHANPLNPPSRRRRATAYSTSGNSEKRVDESPTSTTTDGVLIGQFRIPILLYEYFYYHVGAHPIR